MTGQPARWPRRTLDGSAILCHSGILCGTAGAPDSADRTTPLTADGHSQRPEPHLAFAELGDHLDQMPDAAAEPVQPPHHHRVARQHHGEQRVQLRAPIQTAGHLVGEDPGAAGGLQRVPLPRRVLPNTRYPRVPVQMRHRLTPRRPGGGRGVDVWPFAGRHGVQSSSLSGPAYAARLIAPCASVMPRYIWRAPWEACSIEPDAGRFDRARRIVLPLGPQVDFDVAPVELTAKPADDLLEGLRQPAGEVAQLPQRLADVSRELPSGPAASSRPLLRWSKSRTACPATFNARAGDPSSST